MSSSSAITVARSKRIIVIDDNAAIHADIRKILCPEKNAGAEALESLESALFSDAAANETPVAENRPEIAMDSAYQGRDGILAVQKAIDDGMPHAMAFVDVRMPPGLDGIETTLELWKIAPDLQIVICTAYSDYSWDDMLRRIGGSDRLVILKKPFDTVEVLQLASSLTEKWNLLQQTRAHAAGLEERVRERTAALEQANRSLHEEIARRKQTEEDLKRARDVAESADRAKSTFLANMSHEIRTPMNGVIGMAHLLLNSPLSEEQKDFAQTLCESGDALLTVINDILDFSKIEAGCMTLESVDFNLAEQLGQAIDLQSEPAVRKNLELVMAIDGSVPPWVRGDSIRLRQVLLNLIGNAIKFTARGEVVLSVTKEHESADRIGLRFEVSDTGIGIAEAVQKKLFQAFAQADDSTTRNFGGTGLGLVICKRLVELMGGTIGLTSAPHEGSIFWFTLDLEKCLSVGVEPEPAAAPDSFPNHRVLAVDDNATNRKLLTHLLTTWQLPHSLAESAQEGLAKLQRAAAAGNPYDLVILDHHMPHKDGLELAAAINADPGLGRPQLVLLTSRGERLAQAELKAHGLAACELKPVHPERFRAALGRVLATAPEKPLRSASAGSRSAPAPTPASEATVLVADDNLVNQKVALMLLRTLGHHADVARNGLEVLAALRRKPYRLVLMDEQMPDMDGLETTRRIRQAQTAGEPGFPPDLRVIAMTANAMAGDREICLAAGMDDYLAKPVKPEALRAVLERHLGPVLSRPASGAAS